MDEIGSLGSGLFWRRRSRKLKMFSSLLIGLMVAAVARASPDPTPDYEVGNGGMNGMVVARDYI